MADMLCKILATRILSFDDTVDSTTSNCMDVDGNSWQGVWSYLVQKTPVFVDQVQCDDTCRHRENN